MKCSKYSEFIFQMLGNPRVPRLLPYPYTYRLGLVIFILFVLLLFLSIFLTSLDQQTATSVVVVDGHNGEWARVVYKNKNYRCGGGDCGVRNVSQVVVVTLAVVSCTSGVRTVEAMTLLKSAILFSKFVRLRILVVTEKRLQYSWARQMEGLVESGKNIGVDVEYEVHRTWFPATQGVNWGELWGKCAFQRIFFPSMFKEMESVLYVDADSLFLADLRHIWGHFNQMNEVQLAGLSAVSEFPSASWYSQSSKTPYYGLRGLNSGVMLMNLTRMRGVGFERKIIHYWNMYGNLTIWPDQDILNVFFHFNPEYMYELDCKFNFRCCHCECWDRSVSPELCMCSSAKEDGVAVLHGNGKMFHREVTQPCRFGREFYNAMRQYNLSSNQPEVLLSSLNGSLNRVQPQPCSLSTQGFLSMFTSYSYQLQHS